MDVPSTIQASQPIIATITVSRRIEAMVAPSQPLDVVVASATPVQAIISPSQPINVNFMGSGPKGDPGEPGPPGGSEKADKVSTSPDPSAYLAGLDAAGNLTVSAIVVAAVVDAINKKHANALDHSNSLDHAPGSDNQDLSGKTDKVPTSPDPSPYLAGLDPAGNLTVSAIVVAAVVDAINKKHSNALDHSNSLDHAPGSDNQDLSGLVEKVAGSSLVPDTEIAKIHANTLDHAAVTVSAPLALNGQAISLPLSLFEKGWGEALIPADGLTAIHMGGLWEETADGSLRPKASPDASVDTFWEVNGSDNLTPRAA